MQVCEKVRAILSRLGDRELYAKVQIQFAYIFKITQRGTDLFDPTIEHKAPYGHRRHVSSSVTINR